MYNYGLLVMLLAWHMDIYVGPEISLHILLVLYEGLRRTNTVTVIDTK